MGDYWDSDLLLVSSALHSPRVSRPPRICPAGGTVHRGSSASLSRLESPPSPPYAIRRIHRKACSRDFDACSLRALPQPFEFHGQNGIGLLERDYYVNTLFDYY